MTNAKTTTRRAALGAVLAAAALGAPALAMAPAAAAPLSPVDRRVTDLWLRRRRLMAIADRWSNRYEAAETSLPAWARSGPVYVLPDGGAAIESERFAGWPQVADLARRPVLPSGAVNARPSWQDIVHEWRDTSGQDAELARALVEWGGRVLEQSALQERAGIIDLEERSAHLWDVVSDVRRQIEAAVGDSPFALAAVVMIELGHKEDVPGLLRASLAAIRLQISGPIAEEADRVLAGAQVEAA